MTDTTKKWHPYVSKFPRMKDKQLSVFHRRCKEGQLRHPIVYRLLADGSKEYIDGRHRLEWAEENGVEWPEAEIQLADDQVWDYMLDANKHRRHMTVKEQNEIIRTSAKEKKSLRRTAEDAGVSQTTVARRLRKPGVTIVTPEKTVGKDGKEYPAKHQLIPELAKADLSPKFLEATKLASVSKTRQRDFYGFWEQTGHDAKKAWEMLSRQREPGDEAGSGSPDRGYDLAVLQKLGKDCLKAISVLAAYPHRLVELIPRLKNDDMIVSLDAHMCAFETEWRHLVSGLEASHAMEGKR